MDSTMFVVMVVVAAVGALLALIPAFIAKNKGYGFITYYVFGISSFLLALILSLCASRRDPIRVREANDGWFRPGKISTYITAGLATLYVILSIIFQFDRMQIVRYLADGNISSVSYIVQNLSNRYVEALQLCALGGCLFAALRADGSEKSSLLTAFGLIVFASIGYSRNIANAMIRLIDSNNVFEVGYIYVLLVVEALLMLTLVFSIRSKNRTVSLTACILGFTVGAAKLCWYLFVQAEGHMNFKMLINYFYNGTFLGVFAVIAAFVAILTGLPSREACRYQLAGAPAPGVTPQKPQRAPAFAGMQPQPSSFVQANPQNAPQPAAAAIRQYGAPSMIVFATASDTAASMAAFANTAQYYTPDYCIERVRANFNLPADACIQYVARTDWNGPVPTLINGQFGLDLAQVNGLQADYLCKRLNLSNAQAKQAVSMAQAMQAPRLGLLWLCVPLPKAETAAPKKTPNTTPDQTESAGSQAEAAPVIRESANTNSDPSFPACVNELIRLYKANPGGFYSGSEAAGPVRAVGEQLNQMGGMDLMLKAHEAFAATNPGIGLARNLEMIWDGIGSWRG